MRRILILLILLVAVTSTAQTPPAEARLVVWLPDQLTTVSPETLAAFGAQADAYAEDQSLTVVLRVKRVSDAGSILSTLRSASVVAPLALPAVTLLNRTDLLAAYQENLIQPLPPLAASELMAGLDETAGLCEIGGVQVGVPFVVDVLHLAYRPQLDTRYDTWDFERVLERAISLQFPGSVSTGLNPVMFLQYITAEAPQMPDGVLQFDATALRKVLDFYQTARENSIVTEETTAYANTRDYTQAILEPAAMQWAVSSSQYMRLKAEDDTLHAAPIPTLDGTTATILDGWCWVIVAPNDIPFNRVSDYIARMNSEKPMQQIAQSVMMLPARPDLIAEVAQPEDAAFYRQLLGQARLLPADSASILVERTLQDAFRAVINGTSAEEAVRAASAQFGG